MEAFSKLSNHCHVARLEDEFETTSKAKLVNYCLESSCHLHQSHALACEGQVRLQRHGLPCLPAVGDARQSGEACDHLLPESESEICR